MRRGNESRTICSSPVDSGDSLRWPFDAPCSHLDILARAVDMVNGSSFTLFFASEIYARFFFGPTWVVSLNLTFRMFMEGYEWGRNQPF